MGVSLENAFNYVRFLSKNSYLAAKNNPTQKFLYYESN